MERKMVVKNEEMSQGRNVSRQQECKSGGFSDYIFLVPFSSLHSHTTSMSISNVLSIPLVVILYHSFVIYFLLFYLSLCDCHFKKNLYMRSHFYFLFCNFMSRLTFEEFKMWVERNPEIVDYIGTSGTFSKQIY